MKRKRSLSMLLSLALVLALLPGTSTFGASSAGGTAPLVAAGGGMSYDIVVDVLEWGSAVTAVIVDTGATVNAGAVNTGSFSVSALTKNPVNGNTVYDGPRTVTNAYVSAVNEKGSPAESGRYIVLELKYGYNATLAEVDGCAAIVYQSRNYWLNLDYSVVQARFISGLGTAIGTAAAYSQTVRPIYDDFKLVSNPVEGYTSQQYRLYEPEAASGKLPLVIFNHGAGETYTANGGGNEGSQLFANMGGVGWVKNSPEPAYVLVPQRSFSGYSRPGVIAFVNDLIAQGKVDGNRVYVSGASAGGQETHSYLREYPEVFAGAIPICPASGSSLTSAQLEAFKDVPIWYIHAQDDRTVQQTHSLTPYNRLLELGAADARRTSFPHVVGTDVPNPDYLDASGAPYQHYPDGHWSWVMVLNNEYVENGGTEGSAQGAAIMDWLFSQTKGVSYELVVDVLEWGSAVTAVIIDTKATVAASAVDAGSFSVSALTKNPVNGNTVYDGPRTVTNAYVSAVKEKGSPAESGRYIVLELKYGYNATLAEVDGSAAIVYQSRNYWLNLDYSVVQEKQIEGFGGAIGAEPAYSRTVRPIYDDFKLVSNPVAGYTGQKYRIYEPEGASGKLPLVIFNHGSGETYTPNGGGNEGSQLFANMGGIGWVKNSPEPAYVLVPQRSFNGYSRPGVIAFVNDLIAQGKVDGSRVYVSGASAGGQETHNYLREYPEVFAGAIPICPSGGGNLTSAQLEVFKDVPTWYIHAQDDRTVQPTHSLTPYTRLLELGAADVRRTAFPHVIGTEVPNPDYVDAGGAEYQHYPDGHWSWVMVLNNEYVADGGTEGSEEGASIMGWLFSQKKAPTFDLVVDVLEWGSAVTAVIVDMKSNVDASAVNDTSFSVSALTKNPVNGNTVYDGVRPVVNAYVSAVNEKGSPAASGRYVVLELKYGYNGRLEEVDGSAAIVYQSRNYWLDLDYSVIQINAIAGAASDVGAEPAYGQTQRPIFDDFKLVSNPVAGYTEQQYRLYEPEAAGGKLPLVIFNHGAGETYTANGGGNEGSQLFANMGGVGWVKNAPEPTYVLVPQRSFSGYSRAGVIAFVKDLIAQGKVDVSRIYVSGASAGGSETHSFLTEYPNVFAAAIPICPAGGANVTVDALNTIKHVPIWYIHAEDDRSVQPVNSLTPYNRLLELGAADARRTAFPHVIGTEVPNQDYVDADGAQYQHYPDGHWSWVMVLNNEYVADGGTAGSEEGASIMGWLFSQKKLASYAKANPASRVTVRGKAPIKLGYEIDTNDYVFESSNPGVARVDAYGNVTPVRAGTAAITLRATDGSGLISSIVITVTP